MQNTYCSLRGKKYKNYIGYVERWPIARRLTELKCVKTTLIVALSNDFTELCFLESLFTAEYWNNSH